MQRRYTRAVCSLYQTYRRHYRLQDSYICLKHRSVLQSRRICRYWLTGQDTGIGKRNRLERKPDKYRLKMRNRKHYGTHCRSSIPSDKMLLYRRTGYRIQVLLHRHHLQQEEEYRYYCRLMRNSMLSRLHSGIPARLHSFQDFLEYCRMNRNRHKRLLCRFSLHRLYLPYSRICRLQTDRLWYQYMMLYCSFDYYIGIFLEEYMYRHRLM